MFNLLYDRRRVCTVDKGRMQTSVTYFIRSIYCQQRTRLKCSFLACYINVKISISMHYNTQMQKAVDFFRILSYKLPYSHSRKRIERPSKVHLWTMIIVFKPHLIILTVIFITVIKPQCYKLILLWYPSPATRPN